MTESRLNVPEPLTLHCEMNDSGTSLAVPTKSRILDFAATCKRDRAQRRVARRKKFSNRWKKAVGLVGKMHRKIFNQRNDFQHRLSREIVKKYGIIVVEDLQVKSLCRGMLAKSVHDAGWAGFFFKLSSPEDGSWWSMPVEPAVSVWSAVGCKRLSGGSQAKTRRVLAGG